MEYYLQNIFLHITSGVLCTAFINKSDLSLHETINDVSKVGIIVFVLSQNNLSNLIS